MVASREDVLKHAARLTGERRPFVLATVVWRRDPTSGKPGMKAVITADGRLHGWLGGACTEPTVIREALRFLDQERPGLLCLGPEESFSPQDEGRVIRPNSCSGEGSVEVFLEPCLPTPRLITVGATPVARCLLSLAGCLGFDRVAVVDEGEEAAAADQVHHGLAGLENLCDPRSYVVVTTMGRYDEDALETVLATPVAYVALVASRKRAAAVLDELRRRGVSSRDCERVCAPAGLDLGPIPHDEISVAILAQIVQLKARGRSSGQAPSRTETAIDPVCGMEVEAVAAGRQIMHEGTMYYFCGPGCQRRFEEDPASFLVAS